MGVNFKKFTQSLPHTDEEKALTYPVEADANPEPWVRPSEWLPISGIEAGDEKIHILAAIHPAENVSDINLLAISSVSDDITIDWGDGSLPEDLSGGLTADHYYAFSGIDASTELTETIAVSGCRQVWIEITPQAGSNIIEGVYMDYTTSGTNKSEPQLEVVYAAPNATDLNTSSASLRNPEFQSFIWLGECNIENFNNYFSYQRNLQCVSGVDIFGKVQSWSSAFNACRNLTNIYGFNFSSATYMLNAFAYCGLRSIGQHDFPNVTNFQQPFLSSNLEVWPLLSINSLPKVTTFSSTFEGSCIREVPDFTFSASTTTCQGMFEGCTQLEKVGHLTFETDTDCWDMFVSCFKLTTVKGLTFKAESRLQSMFENCYELRYVPTIDCTNITELHWIFRNCYQMTDHTVLKNTQNVENWNYAFSGTGIETIKGIDMSGATNTAGTFASCDYIEDLSDVEVILPNTTDVDNLFQACKGMRFGPKLLSAPLATKGANIFVQSPYMVTLGDIYLPNVTSSTGGFNTGERLRKIGNIYMPSVTTCQNWFYRCYALSKIKSMTVSPTGTGGTSYMFRDAQALIEPPWFDTSAITRFNNMFYQAYFIQDVPAYDCTACQDNYGPDFSNAYELKRVRLINIKASINLSNCELSRPAIVEVFHNLVDRSAIASQNVNITGCPGASVLTVAERAIATDKNWTITG